MSQPDHSREPENEEVTVTFSRDEVEALIGGVEFVNVLPARRSAYDKLRSALEGKPIPEQAAPPEEEGG